MAIETCKNCKRIIGELEQAYTWQSHILCKECYARLSSPAVAQPTLVDVHTPVMPPPPQRSLVKSTIIVMATVIVVIVTAVIVVIFIPAILSLPMKIDQVRVITTKTNLKILHHAVNQFKMDTGRLPTEEEGLMAIVEQPNDVTRYEPGGYLEPNEIPKDAWGNDFVYHLSPDSYEPFVIISYGADGKEGGEGIDADIRSTDPD